MTTLQQPPAAPPTSPPRTARHGGGGANLAVIKASGDDLIDAHAGDLVVAPRDVPHRFRAGPDGARMQILIAPAGLENLIREQSVPATSRTLPPPGGAAPDLAKAKEIALRYGCELFV